jgi:hypothetical protein
MLTLIVLEEQMASKKRASRQEVQSTPESALRAVVGQLRTITSALPLDPEARAVGAAARSAEELIASLSSGQFLDALRSVRDDAQAILSSGVDELPIRLSRVLNGGVDVKGASPDYILEGSLHVHLDQSAQTLIVAGNRLPTTPWKKTAQAVARALTELRNLEFNPDTFLKSMFAAYQQVLADTGKSPGAIVPIERIMQALALAHQPRSWRLDPTTRNYRSYGRDELRTQLYRLTKARQRAVLGGHRLNLAAGSNTDNALFMYVPSLARCAYVGVLSWTPDPDAGATS